MFAALASKYRPAARKTSSSETTKAPSNWASSFTVPHRSAEVMRLRFLGCPSKGLRMRGRDHAITASASPIVNSVPIRRPSLPSRAISIANSSNGSRVFSGQLESFEQMILNMGCLLLPKLLPQQAMADREFSSKSALAMSGQKIAGAHSQSVFRPHAIRRTSIVLLGLIQTERSRWLLGCQWLGPGKTILAIERILRNVRAFCGSRIVKALMDADTVTRKDRARLVRVIAHGED